MKQYRFYNKSAVDDGFPKEEYASQWFDSKETAIAMRNKQWEIEALNGFEPFKENWEIEERELQ